MISMVIVFVLMINGVSIVDSMYMCPGSSYKGGDSMSLSLATVKDMQNNCD